MLDIPDDAGYHQHVAVFREVMRLEFGHAVDVDLSPLTDWTALPDVAHGKRRPDQKLSRQCRFRARWRRSPLPGMPSSSITSEIRLAAFAKRDEATHRAVRRLWRRLHADAVGRGCRPVSFFSGMTAFPAYCLTAECSPHAIDLASRRGEITEKQDALKKGKRPEGDARWPIA